MKTKTQEIKGMKVVNRNCPKSGPMLKKMIEKAKEEGYSGLMFVSEKQGNTQFHFSKKEEKEVKKEPCFAICNDGNFFKGFPPVYVESSTKREMLEKLSVIYRMMNPEVEFFPYSIEDLKTRYYMGSAVEAYIADDWVTVSKHGERMKDFVSNIKGVLSFDEFVEKYKVEPIEEEPVVRVKEEIDEPVPGEMFEGVLIPNEFEIMGEFLDEDEEEILRESYGEDVIPYEDGIEL